MRGQLDGIQPDSEGVVIAAVQGDLGHTVYGKQLRYYHTVKIVRDLRSHHFIAGKRDIEYRSGRSGGQGNGGIQSIGRQLGLHRVDPGQDIRHREDQLIAAGQYAGLGHCLLDGSGDKALNQIGSGTVVAGGYGNYGVGHVGILSDRHVFQGLESEQGNQEADADCQHRPFNKDISKHAVRAPEPEPDDPVRTGW